MTDEIFMARLHGYAYAIQARGYGDGPVPGPRQYGFQPIVPVFKNTDGTIDREKTLDNGFTSITGIERAKLLKTA